MKGLKILIAWGGLSGLLIAIVWGLIAADIETIQLNSESLMQKQALLARLEKLPQREDQIREALQTLDDGREDRSLYRGDLSSIRNQVQRDIRNIASGIGIRIGAMRPLGLRKHSDFSVGVSSIQLSYQATNEEHLSFLQQLEAAEPILRVQRMSISVQSSSTEHMPAQLSVSLEVAGFVLDNGGRT